MRNDNQKLRVGILGVSQIAERYGIPAFQSMPEVDLVAIASRSSEKAQVAADKFGLEAEGYDSLLARSDIDIIYSPLPVGLQEEWSLKIAEAGKHMIAEKSITYSYESAKKMVEVYQTTGLALYENFVPEFHPQHKQVLQLIAEGKIGEIRAWSGAYGFPPFPPDDIRYSAELKGGALNDCGCYTVFMARKILQTEPTAVTCVLHNDGNAVDVRGSALLEFTYCEAQLVFGFEHLYQNRYSVWGSKGKLQVNRSYALPPTLSPTVELTTNDGTQDFKESFTIPATNQFAQSFDFFCQAVANKDTDTYANMYDRILKQAKVLEAMRISARESRRVELSEIF